VRLITRNGYDWTNRYPWIVEPALKNRQKQFIIDGEAVILGVDGIPDFNSLHSRRQDDEVQLYVCVPKTLSELMTWWNRLSWRNDRAALFPSGRPGSKLRLEAENAVLRHQLNILRCRLHGRVRLTNHDRWFFIQLI
jgi:bifunctional non-homologous end joining protein LigD